MWETVAKFGRKLVQGGLTHAHFGNISVRNPEGLLITRRGSMLDEIDESMTVQCSLDREDSSDSAASSELIVHRRIYLQTSAGAIIHAHSPYAVALSMLSRENCLQPRDEESKLSLGVIPLVNGVTGSEELAANLAEALQSRKAAIARGHGTFAVGSSLEEAYINICTVEYSCQVHYLFEIQTSILSLGDKRMI